MTYCHQVSAANNTILLTGVAPLEVYEALLQSLNYSIDAEMEPPCPLERNIRITLLGGL